MRPCNLVSIAVDTPALTTATMTLVRPIEAILITGGDVWTYTNNTHTLASVLMSGNINQRQDYTQPQRVSHSHTHTDREMIYSMSENITVTFESLLSLSVSRSHSLLFNFTASCYKITTVKLFFLFIFLSFSLFLSFYNSVPEAIEPSLCVPLRGETAVKNILFFMSNFPSSHSPAQIKHATFRERERNSE